MQQVDAALDTLNAERVADYMLISSRGGAPARPGQEEGSSDRGRPTQFIVVSHKPQVFERASCLVGVYSCKGASSAVTGFFEQRQQ